MANDMEEDNNKIEEILCVSYILKTMRLVVILINISFLTGVFWLMMCEFIQDFVYDVDLEDKDFDEDLFLVTFKIHNKD